MSDYRAFLETLLPELFCFSHKLQFLSVFFFFFTEIICDLKLQKFPGNSAARTFCFFNRFFFNSVSGLDDCKKNVRSIFRNHQKVMGSQTSGSTSYDSAFVIDIFPTKRHTPFNAIHITNPRCLYPKVIKCASVHNAGYKPLKLKLSLRFCVCLAWAFVLYYGRE